MGKCRKGFTIIELMVAITILVLLMGIVMVGFGVVGNRGRATDTKVALEAAKSMLGELDATGGLSRVKDLYFIANVDNYVRGIMAPDRGPVTGNALFQSQAVFGGSGGGVGNTGNTAHVMRQLYSMPNNVKTRDSLPAQRTAKIFASVGNPNSQSVTVLVDGWSNPILFVPAGGMRGLMDVSVAGIANPVVTSGGIINYNPNDRLPPGARGFFASAGADGDFATHQDNLYSFEN